jgi:GT2 family glycosyltransferase
MINDNKSIEVFIINYNGKNTILSTIDSLYKSEEVKVSVSVIDDHSSDGSPELVKKSYPEIPVHIMPYNTKRANILRNKALKKAKSKYVFVTDNDLKYEKRCLIEMLKVMSSDNSVATCSPRLMYWDQTDKIYAAGTKVHFIGAAICELRDKTRPKIDNKPKVNSGGGICLIRLEAVNKIGGFDENFMQGWGSDGEFYQRLLRAGYKCFYVPTACALHEDKLDITARKFRVVGQTHNRWMFILSHYSLTLIILSIPPLILYEIFQLVFVLIKGVLREYLKGNILVIKNFGKILKKRKFVQSMRKISDKKVLSSGEIYVSRTLIEKSKFIKLAVGMFSSMLDFYWSMIKKVIP